MAVLQYGAIVTEIKGSLGGHTFKKQGTSFVVQVKSPGFSKSKQLLNPALGYAGFIFQQWIQLPDTSKEAWNNEALLVTFKDKFGNDVSISGRDLFTKLNLHLGVGYLMDVPPPGFTSAVDAFVISNGEFVASPQSATVSIIVDSETFTYFDITAEISVNRLRSPVFRTRALIKRQQLSSNGTINFTNEFFSKFAYATTGYFVRYYVTALNAFGFKGLTQTIDLSEGVVVPSYTIIAFSVVSGGDIATVSLDSTDITGYLVNVYASVSAVSIPADNFASATGLGLFAVNGSNQVELANILKVIFPAIDEGYFVRVYTVLNKFGNNYGVPQTATTEVGGEAPVYTLDSLTAIDPADTVFLAYTIGAVIGYSFNIYAVVDTDEIPPDNFASAELIGELSTSAGSPLDLSEFFNEAGIFINTGYGVRVYTVLLLDGSPVSPPQTITTTVTASAPVYSLTSLSVTSSGSVGSLAVSITGGSGYNFKVYATVSQFGIASSNFDDAIFLKDVPDATTNPISLNTVIVNAFPSINAGWSVRVFTRLYSGASPVSVPQNILTTVVGANISYTITSLAVVLVGEETNITFSTTIPANYLFDVYALWIDGPAPPNNFGSAEYVGEYPSEDSNTIDIADGVYGVYSAMIAGDWIRIWTVLKSEGVTLGSPVTATTVVQE